MAPWQGNHLWVFTSWRHGGIEEAVETAVALGFDGLIVKAHDGNPGDDSPEFAGQLEAAVQNSGGLSIGAWGYLYGPKYGNRQVDVEAEAIIATIEKGIDWYVIDAEAEWEVAGGAAAARRLMRAVRREHPDFPIGFSSFWNMRWHGKYPFSTFARYCDVVLPQVYYVLAKRKSADEISSMWTVTRRDFERLDVPIAPVGQLDGATTEQVEAFREAIGSTTPHSWWLWDQAARPQLEAAAGGGVDTDISPREHQRVVARMKALENKLNQIRSVLDTPLEDDSGGTLT
jgi:hypothetical protein